MKRYIYLPLVVGGSLLLYGAAALAETSIPTVMTSLKSSASSVNQAMTSTAIRTLGVALLLQWILSNWKDIFSGELTSMFAKIAGLVSWAGVCFWAMGNQDILSTMFDGYLNVASNITGIKFNPGNIWANGVDLQNNMVVAFNNRTGSGDSAFAAIKNFLPALLLMAACIMILVAYGVICLSVFVAMAEFWLMFTVVPIAFALLGLQAFRDQGMAPLKGVISLGLRLIILGVIVKILGAVQGEVMNAFNTMPEVNPMEAVWYAVGGVFACAVMAFNAGKIASAIASGSSNFSGSDAIRGGMQMVGTTAAIATTAAAGAGLALAAGQSMTGSAADKAAGLGKGIGGLMGGNNLGVSGGSGLGGGGGGPAVGGPLPQDPSKMAAQKFASSDAGAPTPEGGGADAPSASNEGGSSAPSAGNASSAGIGGTSVSAPEAPGFREKAGKGLGNVMSSLDKMSQAASQDNQSVSVNMNTRGE
jgi:hypothetical protein